MQGFIMLERLKYVDSFGIATFNLRGAFRLLFMLVRGAIESSLLRRAIFMGRGARLQNIRYLQGSGVLKVEDFAIIQGVSTRGVSLGAGVSFGAYSQLRPSSHYGGLLGEGCSIGEGSTFGPFAYIGCGGFIEVGINCMFGPRVSLIAESHVIPEGRESVKGAGLVRKGIKIGNDCWIGANVVILDGALIGDGVIIGAGAVVRSSIPAYSIAVGVPARVVKSR
jgi:acetyltransferase-like isoleucine patch superfamily enzyme